MKKIGISVLKILILSTFTLCIVFAQRSEPKQSGDKKKTNDKKICITFNNLPAERIYSHEERIQINEEILAALIKHNVPAAGFVIGDNIEGDWKILVDWLEAGQTLGFMPSSGQDVDNVPVDMFLADITKGKEMVEDIVASYDQKGRYFRFPFLHYGEIPEAKNKIEKFLKDYDINIAHATVITEDFVYNLSLEKIIKSHDSVKVVNLRDEYIAHILERLGYYESLAIDIMDRPIRHILQLRANRLNAMFLDDILTTIEDKGYQFISLSYALKDKVYQRPDGYYDNRGVSFLDRIKYSDPDLVPATE
jgi:peptidoglycan/xylan/chitin deacetylase (PgdA/CDA1 family)